MSEPQTVPDYRVDNPAEAFERMKRAVAQALTVSKPEIVRREVEAAEQRKNKRSNGETPR